MLETRISIVNHTKNAIPDFTTELRIILKTVKRALSFEACGIHIVDVG